MSGYRAESRKAGPIARELAAEGDILSERD
jgi:hypothetical protein